MGAVDEAEEVLVDVDSARIIVRLRGNLMKAVYTKGR
jgi:hypothetical protein